jgi:glutamyl-tRNA synthetase
MSSKPAQVRFAPSTYLLAQQTGGQFILRIEDTDTKRFVPGAEKDLIDGLHWLGIQWHQGPDIGGPHAPYHQSKRKDIYLEYAEKLVGSGHAFYCFCTREELAAVREAQQKRGEQPRYAGPCRGLDPAEAARRAAGEEHVIRFKMPKEGSITAHDRLRGDITVENRNLDDYILVKSDGFALYHLAAMVDDHLMGITHVFRGEEWLPTFPLHVHIYRAFGWEEPEWVHLSLFLKPSGKGKMSKRETEAMKLTGQSIFVQDLKDMGYLPEGVINWIALMGWSYDDKAEFFTMQDLIEKFSIDKLNASPAAIDFKKLDHFNGLHIRALETDELVKRIKPYFEAAGFEAGDKTLAEIAPLIQMRMTTLDEAPQLAGFFFKENVQPQPEELVGKDMTAAQSAEAARRAHDILAALDGLTHEAAEEPMRALAEELGLKAGQLFGILRAAVTGQSISPPLFESMQIIGREKTLERIQAAADLLEAMESA